MLSRTCSSSRLRTNEPSRLRRISPMNPLTMKKDIQGMLDFLNSQPEINWDDKQFY